MPKIKKGDKREPKRDENGELVVTETGSIAGIGGRPKGAKSKTTIFKEAMREGFERRLEADGLKVFNAVVQKAIGPPSKDSNGDPILDEQGNQMYIDGDSTAQKMLMDRLIPVADVVKTDHGKFNISINVQGMSANITEATDITDADYEEVK